MNLKFNHEEAAGFSYQPGECRLPYRMVVVRKNLPKMKGDNVLFDEIRYFFYITTRTDLSAAQVVRCANGRCDQENVIEQPKHGVRAPRVPLYDLMSNWGYMMIATLAWNIKSWFATRIGISASRTRNAWPGFEGGILTKRSSVLNDRLFEFGWESIRVIAGGLAPTAGALWTAPYKCRPSPTARTCPWGVQPLLQLLSGLVWTASCIHSG